MTYAAKLIAHSQIRCFRHYVAVCVCREMAADFVDRLRQVIEIGGENALVALAWKKY